MKKLFIGGLSWGTDDDSLRAAFEEFGNLTEARVIMDRDTGRSKGFGFIGFEQDADAEAAMQHMDGVHLDGRAIRVNEANARSNDRPRRDDRPSERRPERPSPPVVSRPGSAPQQNAVPATNAASTDDPPERAFIERPRPAAHEVERSEERWARENDGGHRAPKRRGARQAYDASEG